MDKVGLLTIRYVKNIKLIWLVKYLLSQISWRKKFCTVLPFFIRNQQCRFLWLVCLFYFRVLRPVFIKRDKTKGPNSSLWYLIMKNCQLAWKIIQKIMRTSWSNNIRKCAFLQWTSDSASTLLVCSGIQFTGYFLSQNNNKKNRLMQKNASSYVLMFISKASYISLYLFILDCEKSNFCLGKSRSNPFLEPTSTKSWGLSFLLKETTQAFMNDRPPPI